MSRLLLPFLFLAALFGACSDPPNFSDEPQIEFLYFSKDTVSQGGFGGGRSSPWPFPSKMETATWAMLLTA